MTINLKKNSFFIFDLDDTLFEEIDFLRSAYRQIATNLSTEVGKDIYDEMLDRYRNKENVFAWIVSQFGNTIPNLTLESLLDAYRHHLPDIKLSNEIGDFLTQLKGRNIKIGLITDGRSITQRNKLKALGIENIFSEIVVSEEFGSAKPDKRNFIHFEEKFPGSEFYFIGDNTAKDFIVPIELGWTTICIKDRGNNIHPQRFDTNSCPEHIISSFKDITIQ